MKSLGLDGRFEVDMSNNYEPEFYQNYRDYLRLPELRKTHDRVFNMFRSVVPKEPPWDVVDLGCGTGEFGRYVLDNGLGDYCGIDLDVDHVDLPHDQVCLIKGDYWEMYKYLESDPLLVSSGIPYSDIFVSLFATEIQCFNDQSRMLYERLFERGAKAGLVSGIFYDSHPQSVKVQEALDFMVFQSNRPLRECVSDFYDEIRIECRVPPGMFKQPFTEVWRILVKKEKQ